MSKRYKTKVNKNKTSAVFSSQAELDFHDFGPITEFEIERILETFIEDSYFANLTRVLVITGTGFVIRFLAPKILKNNKYVLEFKQASTYNGGLGALEINLKSNV